MAQGKTGVYGFVGIPGSGKTWLASRRLAEHVEATGWPALVIDNTCDPEFRSLRHARSVREAIDWVWGASEHVAFTPTDPDEVEQLARACLDPGHVNLLIDELSYSVSSRRNVGSGLVQLMRLHRHANVNIFWTTQHLTGDVPQEVLSCAPRIAVFRCTAPAVLERLKQEGIDVAAVAALPAHRHLEHYSGF